MRTRKLCVAAVSALTCLLWAVCAQAASWTDDFLYRMLPDGTVALTGHASGLKGSVLIPDQVNGYIVSQIEDYAFAGSAELVEAVIPHTIERVGAGAFQNCRNLESLTICAEISDKTQRGVVICARAFSGCKLLEQVNLSENVIRIEEWAFEGDTMLSDVLLPTGAAEVDATAFPAGAAADDQEARRRPGIDGMTCTGTQFSVNDAVRWGVEADEDADEEYRLLIYRNGQLCAYTDWLEESEAMFKFPEAGVYRLLAEARTEDGVRSQASLSPNVYVDVSVPQVLGVTSRYTMKNVGDANRWYVDASGGTGMLEYRYRLFRDGEPVEIIDWSDQNSWAGTLVQGGVYRVETAVRDAAGMCSDVVTGGEMSVIGGAPEALGIEANVASGAPGDTVMWSVDVTGGAGGLEYHYRLYRDGEIYSTPGWQSVNRISCVLGESGVYQMQVRVRDKYEQRSEYLMGGAVYIGHAPEIVKVTSDSAFCKVGEASCWRIDAQGGVGGLEYHFRLFKDGEIFYTLGWRPDNFCEFVFDTSGVYTMQVRLRDAAGNRSDYRLGGTVTVSADVKEPPVLASVTPVFVHLNIGDENCWRAETIGGDGALQYHYLLTRNGESYIDFGWMEQDSLTYVFAEPGSYAMQVTAQDASGLQSASVLSGETEVKAPPPVLHLVESDENRGSVGGMTIWTVSADSGFGTLQYHGRIFRDGEEYYTFGWQIGRRFAFIFTEPGAYELQVRVRDEAGSRSEYLMSEAVLVYGP